jgi:hypothetical protein
MNRLRRRILGASAAIAAIALAAAPAGASAQVPGGIGQGGQVNGPALCVAPNAPSGIGDAGATFNQACGGGLVFFGPSIGQIGAVVGPTIIGSTIVAPITGSLGPVAVSPVP